MKFQESQEIRVCVHTHVNIHAQVVTDDQVLLVTLWAFWAVHGRCFLYHREFDGFNLMTKANF